MRKTTIVLVAFGLALIGAQAQGQAQPAGGWREVDPENILVIDTNKGRIIAELSPLVAPKTVERIKELTRQGLYDNRKFFRVINDFMAQTGDPKDSGIGGSALPDLQGEFTFRRGPETPLAIVPTNRGLNGYLGSLPVRSEPDAQMSITADGKVRAFGVFCPGVLGMARADDPNSANSQFFFMRSKTENLNAKYTAFGRVLSGLDVVRAIKPGQEPSGAVPDPMDEMTKVRVLADLPADSRPKIRVQAANSREFTTAVQALAKTKGGFVDICDLDIPVSVQ